jgi:hypothetical protein
VQPPTKPGLDDRKHLGERRIGVAVLTRLRESAFAKMRSRHACP